MLKLELSPTVTVALCLLSGQWVLVKPNSTLSPRFSVPGDRQTQGYPGALDKQPEYQGQLELYC